ncbi:hypothetical protein HV559_04795 [Mannheimia pernigra]|uniref:Collagen triple helix repeat-containing protein n=1 Tax=Mannheimia pernigra TaxID=111844 RepID=A0A7D5IDU7_9PAST|nr:hypothetical protein HV559_04795 [Mannheimia pernigra]
MSLSSASYANEYVNVDSFSKYNQNKESSGALAVRSIAIGGNAYVDNYGAGSIAIGENAWASAENSVALGQNAISENAVSTSEIEINGKVYKFAGGVASGTVSIGGKSTVSYPDATGTVSSTIYNVDAVPVPFVVDDSSVDVPTYRPEILSFDGELPPVVHVLPNDDANKETRTITNVAAGRISATSTDAVNGSQLYAVIDSLSSITASSGRRGEKGEQGLQGLKGDKGERGEQGLQGLKGDKGERGEQGLQGLKGDKGERGEQGLQGLKGDKGERGEQGLQGLKGDKGERGEQGLQGLKGDKGERGEQGLQGLK